MELKVMLERLPELNPKAKKADGFDDAILGLTYRCGDDNIIAYDYDKCVEILQKDLSYEDAVGIYGI